MKLTSPWTEKITTQSKHFVGHRASFVPFHPFASTAPTCGQFRTSWMQWDYSLWAWGEGGYQCPWKLALDTFEAINKAGVLLELKKAMKLGWRRVRLLPGPQRLKPNRWHKWRCNYQHHIGQSLFVHYSFWASRNSYKQKQKPNGVSTPLKKVCALMFSVALIRNSYWQL